MTEKRKLPRWAFGCCLLLLLFLIRGRIIAEAASRPEEMPTIPTPAPTALLPVGQEEKNAEFPWPLTQVDREHPAVAPAETRRMEGVPVDVRVYEPLSRMLRDAREAGFDVCLRSGVRSGSTQSYLYRRAEEIYGVDNAPFHEAPRGCSEHESGLSYDICDRCDNGEAEAFADTELFRWLQEHGWEYGFILRYPPDNKYTTGFCFQPCHYRYVGAEAAREITERGWILEEYWHSLRFPGDESEK